jgi:putative acetyltransferase
MSTVIRNFGASDHEGTHALWSRTPGVGLSTADNREQVIGFLQRNPGMSFVATTGGKVVGTVLCGHDGRRGLIHHLVVDAEHRRRGVASRLVNRALGALGPPASRSAMMVFGDNPQGLAFWSRIGDSQGARLVLTRHEPWRLTWCGPGTAY